MSADNFLYVGKRGDKWCIVDRSVSLAVRHGQARRRCGMGAA